MTLLIIRIILSFYLAIIPVMLSINTGIIFIENFKHKHTSLIIDSLIGAAVIFVIIESIKYFKLNKFKKLEETLKVYRTFISCPLDEKLKEIYKTLNLTEKDRISVFLYSASLDKFYSIGRYSFSREYNKTGRYVIDDKNEYVYKVINEEEKEHYKKAPLIKNHWYIKNKRNMESKDMYGVAILNKNYDKIGVIIYQSIEKERFLKQRFKNRIKKESKKIEKLIRDMKIDPNYIKDNNHTIKGF